MAQVHCSGVTESHARFATGCVERDQPGVERPEEDSLAADSSIVRVTMPKCHAAGGVHACGEVFRKRRIEAPAFSARSRIEGDYLVEGSGQIQRSKLKNGGRFEGRFDSMINL